MHTSIHAFVPFNYFQLLIAIQLSVGQVIAQTLNHLSGLLNMHLLFVVTLLAMLVVEVEHLVPHISQSCLKEISHLSTTLDQHFG